jgi:uncharacterized protein (DUF2336 family)
LTARSLSSFVSDCQWLSPVRAQKIAQEGQEKALVAIALTTCRTARERNSNADLRFVACLRQEGQLTASLVLRSLLSGERLFFEAVLVELTGLPRNRVEGLVSHCKGSGFEALYYKADLPAGLLPAFRAALCAHKRHGLFMDDSSASVDDGRLSRPIVEEVLAACQTMTGPDATQLIALLHRLASEAARDDVRHDRHEKEAATETLLSRLPSLETPQGEYSPAPAQKTSTAPVWANSAR